MRYPPPPSSINRRLHHADGDIWDRLLNRYDKKVDNGTYTRGLGGPPIAVKSYSCPTQLMPSDWSPKYNHVLVASLVTGGGLPEDVLLASLPGGKAFNTWKGAQGVDCSELIIKIVNSSNASVSKRGRTSIGGIGTNKRPREADPPIRPGPGAASDLASDIEYNPVKHRFRRSSESEYFIAYCGTRDGVGPERDPGKRKSIPCMMSGGLGPAKPDTNDDRLPAHIRAQLCQATQSTLGRLLRRDHRSVNVTRGGRPIKYSMPGVNDNVDVSCHKSPVAFVPTQPGKMARYVLVASGQGLTEAKVINNDWSSNIYRIWNGGSGRMPEYDDRHIVKGYGELDSDDEADVSLEGVEQCDVGEHNLVDGKRSRNKVDYKSPADSSNGRHTVTPSDQGLLRSSRPRDASPTRPHTINVSSSQSWFMPSGSPSAGPGSQSVPPSTIAVSDPPLERQETHHAGASGSSVVRESRTQSTPQDTTKVLTDDQKRRTEFCFVGKSTDEISTFSFNRGADTIEGFFGLAKLADTIEPNQKHACLSAEVPGVRKTQKIGLYANFGFNEMLAAIASSKFWDFAGERSVCAIEVREL